MSDEEQQMQRAVQEDAAFQQRKASAAVEFAFDYSPLFAAMNGNDQAKAIMATRLDNFLAEYGLKIIEAEPT